MLSRGRSCLWLLLVQVVHRNHPLREDNPAPQKALWPVLVQYLLLGQFEYVLDGDPLPIAILSIDAIPRSTFPWWRSTRIGSSTFGQEYLSLAALALILSKNGFFCVEDIKAAHLLT